MASGKKAFPDFFEETSLDPMHVATGRRRPTQAPLDRPRVDKKKAGFYLPVDLLDRFNRKFHELKLAGVAVDNKSALVEIALVDALDDLDKGDASRILKKL
jgi:hypothetical protein